MSKIYQEEKLSEFSPIALFVFARPEHTKRTLNNLATSELAQQSDLFIFSDGPRNNSEIEKVEKTRIVAREARGFKSITIIEHNINQGLAKNILSGVAYVIKKYGRIIVMEDDILVSHNFLRFMNDALDRYKNDKRVWHVNGWNYPNISDKDSKAFFWRLMHCWGWATWEDRWNKFEKNPKKIINSWDEKDIFSFNLDGSYDFWSQVISNNKGEIDTWAVFWYASIYENKGLCLSPPISLTENIGLDGSGINCGLPYSYQSKLIELNKWIWPEEIKEMESKIKQAIKLNLEVKKMSLNKIKNYVRNKLLYFWSVW